ncbi:MAG: class II D-tagatose-bisphosphate aldolase, non-catalytic subunit [Bacteroidales bacterium]|nr:class II D-tagatose-bisphosphate aldolase, non-catalytic subunit [Bacteroidales bacterium]
MNRELRERAASAGLPLVDFILKRIRETESISGIKRTIFAACPNSVSVIRAALKSSKRCDAPIKFAATLNQVDLDGGYTGLTHAEFVQTIRMHARNLNVKSPVIIAIDHGGPWLKDLHRTENWSYDKTMSAVKHSFEAAIEAGFDLIHVDPTVDITLNGTQQISIETVAERTIELISHTERFRTTNKYPRISYEVGTEEVHGGLADLDTFKRFLELLKHGLKKEGIEEIWPCFVVGKVGTDLHTSTFDPLVARQLTEIAVSYGSLIKGHYSDNVTNPEAYPESGMGAANVGPEFTEKEYEALEELEDLENSLYKEGRIGKPASLKKQLWDSVIRSGRWKKWLQPGENAEDFYSLAQERQDWLIKTGCRYIWEDPEVISARTRLYRNIEIQGIDPSGIVESSIENAMDRYFYRFNIAGLNKLL